MEKPGNWVKKIKNSGRIMFAAEAFEKMNEENLRRQDLHLFRIKELRVVVSDLGDGRPESNGSLFRRITDVRFIGTP